VRRRERNSDETEGRPPSKTRRVLFWILYTVIFAGIVTVLLFPYDMVAKRVLVHAAARNGMDLEFESFDYRFPSRIVCGGMTVASNSIDLEFESFDYRFPSRIVCRGMTVASRGDGLIGGSTYWPEFECEADVRALFDRRLDITHFRGALDSGSVEEGEYAIEGSIEVSGTGASSAPSPSDPVVHIRNLTLRGQGVNLSVSGDVSMSGSVRSIGLDLSVDIEQLDQVTSANNSLAMVFMGLKFAMGADEPPLRITMRGRGADIVVEKKPFDGTLRQKMS